MAPNIIERIQAKIEIFRLEQRYTRRRHRRSTFQSNAVYVDGEYIYQTPNSTGSSSGSNTSGPKIDALHEEEPVYIETSKTEPSRKRLSRFSSMPGFGSSPVKRSEDNWRATGVSANESNR